MFHSPAEFEAVFQQNINGEIQCQQKGGLLGADPFQTGNKVDHIAGGRLVFCLGYGEGRAALLAVRPLITHQQRRAGLSTAARMRRSSCR